MRPIRTYSEIRALNSLKHYLTESGLAVDEVPGISDKPDAALLINGERVAVEFRIISIERLLRLNKIRLPNNEPCQVFYPVEPHIWVESAILAKNPKIADYKRNAGAAVAWLVLHSPYEQGRAEVINMYQCGAEPLFKAACCRTPHSFDRIYLAGQDGKQAICIFNRSEISEAEMLRLSRGRATGVIIESATFSTMMAEDDGNGGAIFRDMRIFPDKENRYFLGSLDPNVQLDYSSIQNLSGEEFFELCPYVVLLPGAKVPDLGAPVEFGVWHLG